MKMVLKTTAVALVMGGFLATAVLARDIPTVEAVSFRTESGMTNLVSGKIKLGQNGPSVQFAVKKDLTNVRNTTNVLARKSPSDADVIGVPSYGGENGENTFYRVNVKAPGMTKPFATIRCRMNGPVPDCQANSAE